MDRVEAAAVQAADALRSAAVQDQPFPHLVVSDLLPEDVYRAALAHWPDPATMTLAQPGYHPSRYSVGLDDRWLATLAPLAAEAWRAVRAAIAGPAAVDAMLARFPAAVERLRIGNGSPMLDVRIIEDRGGHAIEPHTDTSMTALTGLFYMPDTGDAPELGTALYRAKDPDFRGDGLGYYPREGFELAGTAPFRPNHLLVFAPGDTTFHGVEPVAGPAVRRLVRVFAFVDTRAPRR